MFIREQAVLNLQNTLIPILQRSWNVNSDELNNIFEKYDIPNFIDVCYERFNSMGIPGIIEELEEYIEIQGGDIENLPMSKEIH